MNTFDVSPGADSPATGTPADHRESGGAQQPMCVPICMRRQNCNIIGHPETGMSSLMEAMILDDTRRGVRVAVLDPHGDLVERLLELPPAAAGERTSTSR